MPPTRKKPAPAAPPKKNPYEVARALYGADFEVQDQEAYTAAVGRWEQLETPEQSYALGHLFYLQLLALQRIELRQLKVAEANAEVAGALEELVGGVREAIAAFSEDDGADDEGDEHQAGDEKEPELVVEDE